MARRREPPLLLKKEGRTVPTVGRRLGAKTPKTPAEQKCESKETEPTGCVKAVKERNHLQARTWQKQQRSSPDRLGGVERWGKTSANKEPHTVWNERGSLRGDWNWDDIVKKAPKMKQCAGGGITKIASDKESMSTGNLKCIDSGGMAGSNESWTLKTSRPGCDVQKENHKSRATDKSTVRRRKKSRRKRR